MADRPKLELAAWAVGAFLVVLLGARLLSGGSGGGGAPVSVDAAQATPARAAPAGASAPRGQLVVDVEGEVRRPGVYRVPTGSRAEAAVTSAGGLTRRGDSAAVNLASPLHDGEQIVVPRRGAAQAAAGAGGVASPGGGSSAGAGGSGGAPISLSQATVAQLDTLDGIGPTLAQRIVDYRVAHGGFRSVDELKQVEGIGEKRFESLKAAVQP